MRRVLGFLVFALMCSAPLAAAATRPSTEDRQAGSAAAPVAVQRVGVPMAGMRDEAAMVLVGTVLIGLGTAVRRSA